MPDYDRRPSDRSPQQGPTPTEQPVGFQQPYGNGSAQEALPAPEYAWGNSAMGGVRGTYEPIVTPSEERPWWADPTFGLYEPENTLRPESRVTGAPVLVEGSRGSEVEALQRLLNRHYGQRLPIDGVFDADVTKAVVVAQAMAGVAADGKVGPKTAAAITTGRKAPPPREDSDRMRGWREQGASKDAPRKPDVTLDVPFMYQGNSYNTDGSAWDGVGPKAFTPGGTACVDTAQAMALTTGAVSHDGAVESGLVRIPEENVIQIFNAGDEVPNGLNFFGEAGAQLHRGDEQQMEAIRERTLRGIAYLDAELEAGHAVVVGVTASTADRNRYKPARTGDDDYGRARDFEGTMDHGVVITGRVGNKYRYHDPGRGNTANGGDLFFILDTDGVLKSDPKDMKERPNPQYYEVSTVIKNVNGVEEPAN